MIRNVIFFFIALAVFAANGQSTSYLSRFLERLAQLDQFDRAFIPQNDPIPAQLPLRGYANWDWTAAPRLRPAPGSAVFTPPSFSGGHTNN